MNHSMNKIILLLALSLLLSACASVPVELNRAAFEFEKIDAVVLSNEIGTISHQESVSGVDSGAMAGGLIGALVGAAIDSGVNSKRAGALEPVTFHESANTLSTYMFTVVA